MTKREFDEAAWRPWIEHVCAAVGVDPGRVDVRAVHALAGAVASRFTRPMGPVSTHLWGLARASGSEAEAARAAILDAAKAASG